DRVREGSRTHARPVHLGARRGHDNSDHRRSGRGARLERAGRRACLQRRAGGKRPGLSLWSLGTEGDVKHVADAPAHQLLWSPDGRRFIAEATIYSRDGQKLAALKGENALLIGWGPQGV